MALLCPTNNNVLFSSISTCRQGRSQDFSKGGGGSYGSKSLEKEKLLVIRIVKEST